MNAPWEFRIHVVELLVPISVTMILAALLISGLHHFGYFHYSSDHSAVHSEQHVR